MHDLDSSEGAENPAKIVTELGKLREIGPNAPDLTRKYVFGEFQVDAAGQRLLRRGEPVPLRNRPFQVLLYLITHRGRLVEQSELLTAIWGAEDVYHDALRKAVGGIRAALGDDSQQPRFIETHWGKGYRFIGEVTERGWETGKDSRIGSVAEEALPTALPIKTPGIEGTGMVPPERPKPGIIRMAAGVIAAVVLVGATIAIRNDRLAHRPITTAVPLVASPSAPRPGANRNAQLTSKRNIFSAREVLKASCGRSTFSTRLLRSIRTLEMPTQASPNATPSGTGASGRSMPTSQSGSLLSTHKKLFMPIPHLAMHMLSSRLRF